MINKQYALDDDQYANPIYTVGGSANDNDDNDDDVVVLHRRRSSQLPSPQSDTETAGTQSPSATRQQKLDELVQRTQKRKRDHARRDSEHIHLISTSDEDGPLFAPLKTRCLRPSPGSSSSPPPTINHRHHRRTSRFKRRAAAPKRSLREASTISDSETKEVPRRGASDMQMDSDMDHNVKATRCNPSKPAAALSHGPQVPSPTSDVPNPTIFHQTAEISGSETDTIPPTYPSPPSTKPHTPYRPSPFVDRSTATKPPCISQKLQKEKQTSNSANSTNAIDDKQPFVLEIEQSGRKISTFCGFERGTYRVRIGR